MPQSANVEFDRNFYVRSHQDVYDDLAKSAAELNNGSDFSPIPYDENDRELFIDNIFSAGYKRESDHR